MRDMGPPGGGKWRWLRLLPPTLALVIFAYLIYAWASRSLDQDHLNGLYMLAMAFSFAPSDLAVLTRGDHRARWRVRAEQLALLDAGSHLFLCVFGVGAGLATLLGLTGVLSGLVYGLFLLLLIVTALASIVALAMRDTASGPAER